MVTKCVEGRWRNRIDRVRADQFRDVIRVGKCRIFGARTSPKHALRLGPASCKRSPAWAAEDLLVTLISKFRISDRNFAFQTPQCLQIGGISRFLDFVIDLAINQSIDPADEETRDAGHAAQISAFFGKLFQPCHVRFRDALVHVLREQQGHVNVDAFADQLLESGDALGRAGNLDHCVLAAQGLPQAPRFIQRFFRLVREIWRHFKADVAVTPLRLLVDRSENVGGILDVFRSEKFKNPFCVQVFSRLQFCKCFRIVRASGDSFLENRRIGCHSTQPVFFDQSLEFSRRDQAAANVIKPNRLPEPYQSFQGIFGRLAFARSRSCLSSCAHRNSPLATRIPCLRRVALTDYSGRLSFQPLSFGAC